MVRIAGAQIDIRLADKAGNLAKICEWIDLAGQRGAQWVIFPECALTGYCFASREEALALAEPLTPIDATGDRGASPAGQIMTGAGEPDENFRRGSLPEGRWSAGVGATEQMGRTEQTGPSIAAVAEACRRNQLHAVLGLLECEPAASRPRLFNAVACVGPGGLIASYRKVHLPHLGVDHFADPGDRPFAVHTVDGLRIGLNICYDSAFPESARTLALLGADVVALPTNFPPGAECVISHVIHARAMENGIYFAAINRVGEERGFRFIGGSKICDPDGDAVAVAAGDEETLLIADIDPQRSRNKLRVRVPGAHYIDRFADRRPEMYRPLIAAHQSLNDDASHS